MSILLHGMAGATRLSSFLHAFLSFFVFFVIRIDKVNSSQSSSIVELRFLFFPIPVLLDSERLYQFLPRVLAINNRAWMLPAVLSVSHRITYIPWEVFLSIK